MEWIVLDDGTDKVGDLFAASGLKNVRYVALPEGDKLPIGAKRNQINELAKGDICVCWDDDDYYFPDRIRHSVMRLQGQKLAPVVGSTEIFMYFPDLDEMWVAGPYNPNHATNGTMAYWRSYFKTHRYEDDAVKAEEKKFMDDWKTPVAQLRPEHVMVVINHGQNTFDKRRLIFNKDAKAVKKTSMKFKGLVKDKKLRDFYLSLRDKIPPYVPDATPAPAEDVAVAAAAAGGAGAAAVEEVSVPQAERPLTLSERMWMAEAGSAAASPAAEHLPSSLPSQHPEKAAQPPLESPAGDRPSVLSAAE